MPATRTFLDVGIIVFCVPTVIPILPAIRLMPGDRIALLDINGWFRWYDNYWRGFVIRGGVRIWPWIVRARVVVRPSIRRTPIRAGASKIDTDTAIYSPARPCITRTGEQYGDKNKQKLQRFHQGYVPIAC